MDDQKLIELYWMRDEDAIRETAVKYGKLCTYIAKNILKNIEDCEECVNDAYLAVWNAIPTQRPNRFAAFISRITRNLALKKYEYLSADKRNPSAVMSLDELGDAYRMNTVLNQRWKRDTLSKRSTYFLGNRALRKEIFLFVAIGILIPLTQFVSLQGLVRVR